MENRENQKMEDRLKAPTTLLPSKSTIVKDSDNDFIEDALDKPGTIAKAKLHGSANRILNIPKTFESDQKVEFCDDCYLPEKTKGVVEEFQFDVDPKRLAIAGYNIYLFFFFMKFIIINLIGGFLVCSLPFIYITDMYSSDLFDYCTEFYTNSSSISGLETNMEECVNFVSKKEFDYTSFDWINRWSGETMLIYVKLIREFNGQSKVDEIVTNFNIITFICLICLFIVNLLFINLSEAIVNEINFNEQSPSDYTLMISDIPKTQSDPEELKNVFLADSSAKIHDINLTYQISSVNKKKESLRSLKKIRRMNHGKEEYTTTSMFCCKKTGRVKDLEDQIHKLVTEINSIEEKYSNNFNGVAFVTFNTETEAEKYYKQFPHSFIHKLFSNIASGCCLYTCCCFLSDEKKKKLRRKQTIAVSKAPEPQDIIWENLENHFISRLSKSIVGYIVSILCIGASFGIVLGLNYLQYQSEKDFENNLILKYGISLSITAVISLINFLMSTFFKFLASIETPWSHTEFYLSLSIKLTFFTFFNSAIVPLASNAIQYGWESHEMLVNNMLMLFLCGSILSPLMSLTCYDLLLQKFNQWLVERKYKDPKEPIIEYSQRELNAIYEGPDMGVSCQYSTLSKQICMTFFYMPIFPLGVVITFVGVVFTYVVEKWKCIHIYKRPAMLNQEICFFYLNYFNIAFFCFGVGNFVFFARTHSTDIYELINIILYAVLTVLPYHSLLRSYDSSGAYKNVNEITYENAYFSFPFDYERMNPVTQKQGGIHYLDRLENRGIISKEMCEKAKEKMHRINVVELFYFTNQRSKFRKNRTKHAHPHHPQGNYKNANNVPNSENTNLQPNPQSSSQHILVMSDNVNNNNYNSNNYGLVSNDQYNNIVSFFNNMGIMEQQPNVNFNSIINNNNMDPTFLPGGGMQLGYMNPIPENPQYENRPSEPYFNNGMYNMNMGMVNPPQMEMVNMNNGYNYVQPMNMNMASNTGYESSNQYVGQ